MSFWKADRLSRLPPYLFEEIDRLKREAIEAGRDVIDLGVGDPDRPTPSFIVERMKEAVQDTANHRYAATSGTLRFRESVARFFQRRFRVTLDPATEVLALIGSKEGIGHLPTAVMNPGDLALIPEPGYPVYASGVLLAGGECHPMPLREENGFLPVLKDIPLDVRRRARLLWLNYPNNPTSAVAPRSFFEEAVAFARETNVLIAQDAAYSELFFHDPPLSILEVEGARDVAVEFHSLSKTFNMTGWRIAFVVGNASVLASLAGVKSHLDSGAFQAIQEAAIHALEGIDRPEVRGMIDRYRRRRDVLVGKLREAGWSLRSPAATFYVWARCPEGWSSVSTVAQLLKEAAVVAVPGCGFGESGEGYVRFALTVSEDRLREAGSRLSKMTW